MIGLHRIERVVKIMHRISTSDWTLAMIGGLLPVLGIIAVLAQG